MACTAYLHELSGTSPPSHVPLAATSVEAVAVDQGTLGNLCSIQFNGRLASGRMGVHLSFGTADLVYQVAVNDPAKVYAGFTVLNLNGGAGGTLDLVVHRLPTSGRAGSTATIGTPTQARAAVLASQTWTVAEKAGVLGLMTAYGSLLPSTDPLVRGFVMDYASILDALGIDPSIF